MKAFIKTAAMLLAILMCMGCAAYGSGDTAVRETAAADDMFTDRDYEVGYSDYVTVTLSDAGAKADGAGVSISGGTVTFTEAGTYLLTGTLTDGRLIVDAADDAKLQLVLDGASVTSAAGAALYVKSADKVFLTTAAGSVNTLSSSADDDDTDGAVFSECDLTMNGRGSLTVTSLTGHGVVCKDDLKLTSGTYEVTAARDGLQANDSVRISEGVIGITSGSDGIEASDDDEDKGFVYISGGTITIESENDGIQASSSVTVTGGDITVTAGGGQANGPEHTDFWGMPNFGGFANENAWEEAEEDTAESDSHKGVKADTEIVISGGTLTLDTADDGIHSNGDASITGGTLTVTSGDDAVHADDTLTVSGGTLDLDAHEGLEALIINVEGGEIAILSDDDGINASGGSGATLTISGGTLHINSSGDSLDANGTLLVTGGEITITGPEGSGNGILDYDAGGTVTGGTVIATGVNGMQQNFGQTSTQGSILYTLPTAQAAGTAVTLTDESGKLIASYTTEEAYQVVLVSSSEIVTGGTYTLTAGTETVTIEMTSLIYGGGMGFGGMGGASGFGRGR